MNKRIKWIVGVGALVFAPLSMALAPSANAGVGGCTTAALGQPIGTFVVNCSIGAVNNCRNWYNPISAPIDEIVVETVGLAVCTTL